MPAQYIIGRSEESDIVLSGDDISRRHALAECHPDRISLRDVSSNGIYILQRATVPGEKNRWVPIGSADLVPGDIVRFASSSTISYEELRHRLPHPKRDAADAQQQDQREPVNPAGDLSKPRLLSPRRRIGRLHWFAFSLLFWGIIGIGYNVWLHAALTDMFDYSGNADVISFGLLVVIAVCCIVVSWILGIQRLHDFDASGWWILIFALPFINLIFGIVMWFLPGTAGNNRFGAQPPPSPTGIRVLAFVATALFVVNILYSMYTGYLSAVL